MAVFAETPGHGVSMNVLSPIHLCVSGAVLLGGVRPIIIHFAFKSIWCLGQLWILYHMALGTLHGCCAFIYFSINNYVEDQTDHCMSEMVPAALNS
ncbi:hypothetical protein TNCT_697261 [Trichonephila clavata]|uniref:Uncharacterized protein n=1 Tax=Trichonephila clavata TaxID=2740835 RepID=A0A8X6HX38_TRICU|nr:hypothetical protein TNCT_697261 [Trichonephila clavata]